MAPPTIRLYDTLSGAIQTLQPRQGVRVGIYACGPTTYAPIHIGNARPYVVFILLRRYLAALGYEPTLVVNLTDINDKIYAAASAAGTESGAHAEAMIALYRAETGALGLGRPDHEPKATEAIAAIIALIEELIGSGHAYASQGDVYFAVRSFADYGKLSNRDPAEMDQGEERGSDEKKRDPLDFALWKAHKPDEDTWWASPWGRGRPGWHIECSAMAEGLLGTDFEIHAGGIDLAFPHHENEIAQTAAARGVGPARIWMHNGMIETVDEKMSKSIGNVFALGEAIERYGAETVVAFLISGHYRGPLAFSVAALESIAAANERIRDFFRTHPEQDGAARADPRLERARVDFEAALAEDFNTPKALAVIYELIAAANREPIAGAAATLRGLLDLLGLAGLADVDERDAADPAAAALLAERESARAGRNFARADAIRDELAGLGWEVRDLADGPRLVRRA